MYFFCALCAAVSAGTQAKLSSLAANRREAIRLRWDEQPSSALCPDWDIMVLLNFSKVFEMSSVTGSSLLLTVFA